MLMKLTSCWLLPPIIKVYVQAALAIHGLSISLDQWYSTLDKHILSVNFINILCAHFAPIFLAPKITKLKHNQRKMCKALLYKKLAHKMLMKLDPQVRQKSQGVCKIYLTLIFYNVLQQLTKNRTVSFLFSVLECASRKRFGTTGQTIFLVVYSIIGISGFYACNSGTSHIGPLFESKYCCHLKNTCQLF